MQHTSNLIDSVASNAKDFLRFQTLLNTVPVACKAVITTLCDPSLSKIVWNENRSS